MSGAMSGTAGARPAVLPDDMALDGLSPEYRMVAERATYYLEATRYVAQHTHLSFFTCGVAVALSALESAMRDRRAA
jgi:hypothetical protein